MDEDMREVIAERRRKIHDDAPCKSCGATLASCKANRGKDPTAPPWFGCCAQGIEMARCCHRSDRAALGALLREIETGHVRSLDEVLLDSVREYSIPRNLVRALIGLSKYDDQENYWYGDSE